MVSGWWLVKRVVGVAPAVLGARRLRGGRARGRMGLREEATMTFDTLAYMRRLEAAGVDTAQAEAEAMRAR